MIRINLLPHERARRRIGIAAPKALVPLAVGAAVILIGLTTYLLEARNDRVRAELKRVNQEIETLRPQVARVEELRRLIESARRKERLLRQLEAVSVPWDTVLEEVRTVMPRDVWLNQADVDDGGTLNFSGFGMTYEAVARFMKSLADSEMFTDVDMTVSQKQRMGGRDVINFNISARLVRERKEAGTR